VKLCEQALRQVVARYNDRVAETVWQTFQEATRKRARGKSGIEKLTMGQMVYALQESKFLEECARLLGKNLRSLPVIDLEKLTQLRNKIIHEHEQATRTEAEFLLHSLKLILETFDLLTFDTPQEEDNMNTAQDASQGAGQSGGVSIGSVGGNAQVTQVEGNMTGDIVGRDKIVRETTTTTTTMIYGFKQESDKAEFLRQIEELRAALQEIKSAIEATEELDEDQKDDLAIDVMQQVKDLKTVKAEAEATPPGKEAPKEKVNTVEKYLDNTATLMEKLKKMGEATAAASQLILPAVVKALPFLAKVRHLFGLP
jgi:hypothetical protein